MDGQIARYIINVFTPLNFLGTIYNMAPQLQEKWNKLPAALTAAFFAQQTSPRSRFDGSGHPETAGKCGDGNTCGFLGSIVLRALALQSSWGEISQETMLWPLKSAPRHSGTYHGFC